MYVEVYVLDFDDGYWDRFDKGDGGGNGGRDGGGYGNSFWFGEGFSKDKENFKIFKYRI